MYAIPLVGQQLVITRALRGDNIGLLAELLVVLSTLAVAALAYRAARRAYQSERLGLPS
jgi:sodium transport system permease protein